jgi:ParB/RepB/Spo0J family partition protein
MTETKNKNIPLKLIVADPNQPRQEFNPKALKILEKSISERGILEALTLEQLPNGKYLLIDGERRFRCATALGLKEVPAMIYTSMNELDRLSLRFHIQELRSNWTEFDKARAISSMKKATGITNGDLADLLGMEPQTVSEYISLLSLSKRTMAYAIDNKLNFRTVCRLARLKKAIENPEQKEKIEAAIIDKLERGIVSDSQHITMYSICIKFLEENPKEQSKLIEKIINNPNYTPKQASIDSGKGDSINETNVLRCCVEIKTYTKRVQATKVDYTLTPDEAKLVRTTIDALADYIGEAKEA